MKGFYKLNKINGYLQTKSHEHVVYLDTENGVGFCAMEAGHTHQIVFVPPTPYQPAQTDQMGNIIAPEVPAAQGGFQVYPAEDGHTHDIVEMKLNLKKKKEEDEEVVCEVVEQFGTCAEVEEKSVKKAEESDKFFIGEQWDESLKRVLEQEERAALVLNKTQRAINELSGYERESRTVFQAAPVGEGVDLRVADLLNECFRHVVENCDYPRAKSKVFMDSAITGRGLFNVRMDFNKNLEGDIVVEQYQWREATFGQHNNEDLSDCEVLFKHKMFSLAKLKQLFPKKAKELEACHQYLCEMSKTGKDHFQPRDYLMGKTTVATMAGNKPLVDPVHKQYCVIERWMRVFIPTTILVNDELDFYQNTIGMSDKDVKAIKEMANPLSGEPIFYTVDRTIQKIRITKVAGNVLLSDEDPADIPFEDFSIIPVYAHKRGNEFWGKVEIVKDAQRELNKRASQEIDILNRMVAYGWFYDENTFANPEEENRFKENSSRPGFKVKLQDSSNIPKMVEGVKMPTELVAAREAASVMHDFLMNIVVVPLGANDNAPKLLQLKQQRLTGNEFLFDSLRAAERRLGKVVLKLIQRYFSPERIYRIASIRNQTKPVKLGQTEFGEYSQEEIINLLETADLEKFDVAIVENTYTPTEKLANFLLLSDFATKGFTPPPNMLIENMSAPEDVKQKWSQEIQAQQQAQQQGQADAGRREVEKTLIAQGHIPPSVAQEFGLNGVAPQQAQTGQQLPDDQQQGGI